MFHEAEITRRLHCTSESFVEISKVTPKSNTEEILLFFFNKRNRKANI